jgi:hypothetical protein
VCIDTELLGRQAHRHRWGCGHVVGAEPQHPQPTELGCPPSWLAAHDPGISLSISIVEREEPVEGLSVESWREPRQPLTLLI